MYVIPPHRAGTIVYSLAVATANDRCCEVDFLTFESIAVRDIHVLGDSIEVAPLMPKSGHMANQQAKVARPRSLRRCRARRRSPDAGDRQHPPTASSTTGWSATSTSVHPYDRAQKTMLVVPGSGGLSLTANESERVFSEHGR